MGELNFCMARKKNDKNSLKEEKVDYKPFHFEYKNAKQKEAYEKFLENDILFLIGPAGTAKTYLSCAFALNKILAREKGRLIISRPAVEAGERIGFMPGDGNEKLSPYLSPIFDAISKLIGKNNSNRDRVNASLEIAPLGFLRGRNFSDAICILDEAQNASYSQLKMYLTRLCDDGSKIIITGDPKQSDLVGPVGLMEVVNRLRNISGIGIVEFDSDCIVRHPLVSKILRELEKE